MNFYPSKRLPDKFSQNLNQISPYAIMLCAFYICGAIIGNCCAFALEDNCLSDFSRICSKQASFTLKSINIFALLLNNFKYVIIILLLSFFLLGIFFIPLAICAKGFGFSFCISCFYRAAGLRGLLSASSALFFQNAALLPFLLIFAAQACLLSKNLLLDFIKTRRLSVSPPDYFFHVFCGCMLICTLSCLFESLVVPALLCAA